MSQPVAINIGHGVEVTPLERDGVFVGIIWTHPSTTAETGRCGGGMIRFKGRAADVGGLAWEVVSEEPLSLTPSLLCTGCGAHGYVTAGAWVPL